MSTTSTIDTVRFNARGQVVVPARLRKQFRIENETKAIVMATPEGILLKPVTAWALDRAYGPPKRKSGAKSLAEEWAAYRREERG